MSASKQVCQHQMWRHEVPIPAISLLLCIGSASRTISELSPSCEGEYLIIQMPRPLTDMKERTVRTKQLVQAVMNRACAVYKGDEHEKD